MAYADDLETIRTNLTARIISVTASDQPTYTDGTRTVDKNGYLTALFAQLEQIDKAISRETPTEVQTIVRPY